MSDDKEKRTWDIKANFFIEFRFTAATHLGRNAESMTLDQILKAIRFHGIKPHLPTMPDFQVVGYDYDSEEVLMKMYKVLRPTGVTMSENLVEAASEEEAIEKASIGEIIDNLHDYTDDGVELDCDFFEDMTVVELWEKPKKVT